LIYARGPCGQEEEVSAICRRELAVHCDRVWTDATGNVIGLLSAKPAGKKRTGQASPIRVMAHMDEIAMIVKRVEPDGKVRVTNSGALRPGVLGQGPVEILAESGIVPGALSIGPQHSSRETTAVYETKTAATEWTHVYVFTNKSAAELERLGVRPGTRVVIARERRQLFDLGDAVGGYFMDDRAPVTVALAAAAMLKAARTRPPRDVYFIMTTEEERGGVGAAYAARMLPGDTILALEIGPIAAEYGTEFRNDPIVPYGDARGLYTKATADRLIRVARRLGQHPQTAMWEGFGSDASIAKTYGQTARAALICMPTLNMHGFEVILRDNIRVCAELTAAFLSEPE
jgi:putative aminopeptidase FrvX